MSTLGCGIVIVLGASIVGTGVLLANWMMNRALRQADKER